MKIQKIIYTAILALFVNHAHAWNITPMSSTIEPEKRTFGLTINNKGSDEMIAIRLSVKARTQDINSNEILTATKDLRLFPRQIIVKPDRAATVRVSVVKPNKTAYEKSYRIIAEAVSVTKGVEATSGVKVLLNYIGSVYLSSKNKLDVDLDFRSARLLKDELILDIANGSSQHKLFSVEEIFASIKGKEVSVDIKDKLSNILSNSEMIMHIPVSPKEHDILKLSSIISLQNNCPTCKKSEKITLNLEQ